ncbi:hypothetical protein ASG88_07815 [Nocardioides sp. Soil777]|uniref:hypothetical protein n=1 Tax=Nocardioides sp. Soil777 TaxID=1736409 RepID=UPI0007035614|nr:hypothetical protein [Nocardioides sp. Soil777]KRF01380.1 hypothetical protein ASG88_07815 [Nocardioides sp. Soil777]
MPVSQPAPLPPAWSGLLDDAAIFPPGDVPLHDATAAHGEHRRAWYADLLGSFVLRDTDLPLVRGLPHPLSVVVAGGAGQVAGPLGIAARLGLSVTGLEIALRDPDDLAGNARRVVAAVDHARGEGLLADDVTVFVELPQVDPSYGWEAAADEVAAAELRIKLRTGGVEAHLFPTSATLAAWIDAALDREVPFKCTAGLHHAVRHTSAEGFEQHGFLNVLLATVRAFDGASRDDTVATLEERDATRLGVSLEEVARARRWFTSFGTCSVDEPLADLLSLDLLPHDSTEPPR